MSENGTERYSSSLKYLTGEKTIDTPLRHKSYVGKREGDKRVLTIDKILERRRNKTIQNG